MSFLSPLAFWLLLVLGPLLWLWRFHQARRTIVVPSLAPFQRLREHMPKFRVVHINWLLLLQMLLLICLVGVLVRPQLHGLLAIRPHQTVAVVFDNSASLRADAGSAPAFVRARAEILRVASGFRANDRMLVVTTAPTALATPQWVTDPAMLRDAVYRVEPTDAPGDLAGAIQFAQAFAGEDGVDRLMVVTDRTLPASMETALPSWVTWRLVGREGPNVALPLVDVSPHLAPETPLRLTASVVNFADREQEVALRVTAGSRTLETRQVPLQPLERKTVIIESMTLARVEPLTVNVRARHDLLEADNTVIMYPSDAETIAVYLDQLPAGIHAEFARLIDSSEQFAIVNQPPSPGTPQLHIVGSALAEPPTAPTLYLQLPPRARDPQQIIRVVDWDTAHPTTRYLTSVDQLQLAMQPHDPWPDWIHPVVWGSDGRRSYALMGVGERHGIREVVTSLAWDAVNFDEPRSVELLIMLLNVCQWLAPTNTDASVATGHQVTIPALPAGPVKVTLPIRQTRAMEHPGGPWIFRDTWWAGTYHVVAGPRHVQFHAHLADEQESNLLQRTAHIPDGIWRERSTAATRKPPVAPRPIHRLLLWIAAALCIAEWLLYQQRIAARAA